MAYSNEGKRLFSVSDDGSLIINDLIEGKIVQEYKANKNKYSSFLSSSSYVPVYKPLPTQELQFAKLNMANYKNSSCPTCLAASPNANLVIIGYADDSLVLRDVRTSYSEVVRLEVGAHTDTVKKVVFNNHDADFLCLTGGSDGKLKLWDLR